MAAAKWTRRKLRDEIREVTGNQITQGFEDGCPNIGFSSETNGFCTEEKHDVNFCSRRSFQLLKKQQNECDRNMEVKAVRPNSILHMETTYNS